MHMQKWFIKGTADMVLVAVMFMVLPLMAAPAKILVLTIPVYSHCLQVSAIGGELAARGHDVKVFLGSKFEHKDCFMEGSNSTHGITPIIYKTPPDLPSVEDFQANFSKLMQNGKLNLFQRVEKVLGVTSFLCKHSLCDKDSVMALKKEKFDLAIVDYFFSSYCIFAIPHTLNIPFVSVSTIMDGFIEGGPTLASIVPSPMTKYTDNMSFWERLVNGVSYIVFHMLSRLIMPTDQISEYIPGITAQSVYNYISRSELFIYNQDTVLGYPVPVMPNHILAGGLVTKPAKPLQGEFKQIYSQSSSSVILVSFGSVFGLLPEKVESNLAEAFKGIEATILWKYTKIGSDGNLIKVSWFPQNDLMGNPKTKLFISHCGSNGLYEALYHGVPILCTPLFGDQFANAVRVEHRKFGRYIDLLTSTEEQIFEAMSDMLSNQLYRDNMKKASAIFNSQPFTPRQRAAFWIEYILKFGGEHLRSRGTDIYVMQFLGFDLLLLMIVLGLFILFGVFKCIGFCYKRCCKGKERNKVKMN